MAHWFAQAGIYFDAKSMTGYSYRKEHLIGCAKHIRHFRALPHLGLLQVCDGYLDRWANSVGAEVSLPKSLSEFRAILPVLLASAELFRKLTAEEMIQAEAERIERCDRELAFLEQRYGYVVDWVRRNGPCYRSDRKVMHRYTRLRKNQEMKRKQALRRFNWHHPELPYTAYLNNPAMDPP
jgi:uncharacterized protein (UPF0335 family)